MCLTYTEAECISTLVVAIIARAAHITHCKSLMPSMEASLHYSFTVIGTNMVDYTILCWDKIPFIKLIECLAYKM
jgi:hypothetical protein